MSVCDAVKVRLDFVCCVLWFWGEIWGLYRPEQMMLPLLPPVRGDVCEGVLELSG